ncbi:MAG: DUF4258 domain-containing protein [Verrucomicrobia bacterium]|nr:DUF4258 domain-containing protein [Verrucomicrobiota bacterium]
MSDTLGRIKKLVSNGDYRISEHGYDELAADGWLAREVVAGLTEASMVEDYPDYPKGPCVLVLQENRIGQPVHAVWEIPKGEDKPAVLVTAYQPDPQQWTDDFMRRKS